MRRQQTFALVASLLTVSTARAEPQAGVLPMPMYGSDTLREVTRQIIETCVLTPNLDYLGTGSTNGGNAMRARNQQIAPQSRFLSSTECSDFGSSPQLGQGITIGLDGIGVFGDTTEPTTCDTLRYSGTLTVSDRNGVPGVQCPNCSGNTYTFSDWRDVLRIIYAGQSEHIIADPCSDSDPSRRPSALGGTPSVGCGNGSISGNEQCDDGNTNDYDGCASNCTWEIGHQNRCNSDLRRELVNSYGNLFQGGCTDAECTELRHAFRRDDSSGTTDTFLTLLGLPGASSRTYCNGFDLEDLDPIRRACSPQEQVCSNVPYASWGANRHGGPPVAPATNPAGTGGDLGLLLAITMPGDTTKQYGEACAFGKFAYTLMPFAATLTAQRCPDGNARQAAKCRWPIDANGKFGCLASMGTKPPIRTLTNMDGRAYNVMPRDPDTGAPLFTKSGLQDPRQTGGGMYRIHQTTPMTNGTALCTEVDATQQIGCLVTASPCSIGYAGREALFATDNMTKSFKLRSPLNDPGAGFPAQEIPLDDILIRRLLDPSGPASGTCGNGTDDNFGYRYPLARRLWINAARGFGLPSFSNIADIVDSNDADSAPDLESLERELATCMADRTLTDQAIVDFGFITLSDRNCSTGVCTAAEREIGYRARSCQPRCGDGIVQAGESCDDGNSVGGDSCPADCTIP